MIQGFIVYEYNQKGEAAAIIHKMIELKCPAIKKYLHYTLVMQQTTEAPILLPAIQLTRGYSVRQTCSSLCKAKQHSVAHDHSEVEGLLLVNKK
jgi:hypothetical protein